MLIIEMEELRKAIQKQPRAQKKISKRKLTIKLPKPLSVPVVRGGVVHLG